MSSGASSQACQPDLAHLTRIPASRCEQLPAPRDAIRGRSDGSMKRLIAICAAVGLVVMACGVIPGTGSGLKIGIVTDIGQLEDKSFNEFSWKGVQDGASAIGAPKPQAIVTKDIADYKQNIQTLGAQNNANT